MEEEIYNLKLHETMYPDKATTVMRVPGGWIYTLTIGGETHTSVFVPFDNEFM